MRNLIKLVFIIVIISGITFAPLHVYARTSEEIEKEIEEKEKELEDLNSDLEDAKNQLENSKSLKTSSLSEVEKTKKELTEVETELEINQLSKQQLEQQIELKGLEREDKEQEQDLQITEAYISWKTDDMTAQMFGTEDLVKNAVYQEFLSEQSDKRILGLSTLLNDLTKTNKEYSKEISLLERDQVTLAEKRKALENQITQLDNTIASSEDDATGLRSQIGNVQLQIEQLTAEQKAINEEDDKLTGGETNGGTQKIIKGEVYFEGTGRDVYQGHGVGMSQFGAYGAALKGMTAEEIINLYYTKVKVENRSGTVRVTGNTEKEGYVNKVINLNDYVAGLGEVPDKACGTAQQQATKPSKYVKDNPSTIWDCWPEEAIKAQVIAARSYAASNGGSICTTAACQVYKGGNSKRWAANETKNQVIISKGATNKNGIIRALYSSDNSQGYGTADNDTIWSNFAGQGTPYSYLRHVDDTATATPFTYTHWKWRTNSYTMKEINGMFKWASKKYTTGGSNSFIKQLKNSVGEITGLSFVRDGSNRIKKVEVSGNKGNSYISGWLFKAVWNSWVYNVKPSGQTDYIYSITWFLKTGQ